MEINFGTLTAFELRLSETVGSATEPTRMVSIENIVHSP